MNKDQREIERKLRIPWMNTRKRRKCWFWLFMMHHRFKEKERVLRCRHTYDI